MAKHREKSSPGNARNVVLGRRGGRFHEGFAQRDGQRAEPRRDEPRRDDARRDEPRRDAPRRDEPRRDAPRRDDARHGDARRDEPRRNDPRRGGGNGFRNREDARVEREPALPAGADNGAITTVLTQLAKMATGATAWQLAQVLGEESREVGQILRRLVEKGQVLESKPGRYQVSGTGGEFPAMLEEDMGKLFARLPDSGLKEVNPRYTIGAKAGDVVQVVLGEDGLALVTRVLRRTGREVVGTIQFKPDGAWLVCDNRREGLLKVVDAFSSFEDDYRIGNRYVGIIQMDSKGEPGVRIDRVLGKESPEIADYQYVCLAHDLPGEFPPEVTAQANAYPKKWVLGTGKAKREDLRKKLVWTIDPATAKDFDDAISLEYDEDGHWILGVHIADVSHYVTEETPLDAEASGRGTSIYLVNRVIPMLPEVLSNGLCSLVPNEPRYCLTAFLTIDRQGKLLNTRLAETLIESRHRFTYEEAMDVLVDRDPKGKWPDDVRTAVKDTGVIAQTLRRNREKAGALNLFSVEHRFKLDVNGVPIEIIGETSDASHQLIEECMLLANRAVAEWLEQKGLPCVYRLHQEPDEERLTQFASVLEVYGKDSSRIFNRFGLQKMLADLAKEPPAARKVLNYLCLRAFKKAVYGIEKLGHYALAFASYAHFTSPIRRYPDLLVHRLVKRGLDLPKYKKVEIRRNYLDALAKQASFLEQRAEQAERDLDARKTARYLAARIGESFPAVVVSAFPGGLSIQLLETGMDGMLPMRELRDDFYTFDPKRLCLVGRRSARTIGCGAELDVIVNSVDIERADVVFGLEAKGSFAQAIRAPKRAPPAPVAVGPESEPSKPVASAKPASAAPSKPAPAVTGKPVPAATGQPAPVTTGKPVTAAHTKPATSSIKAPAAKGQAAVAKPAPAAKAPGKQAAPKAAVTATEEPEELELTPDAAEPESEPETAARKPGRSGTTTLKKLPIDRSIDRNRVPERWRAGRSGGAERSERTEPTTAKPKPPKLKKVKKKHRW